ncbi:FAD/NAD(P)-binding protein [Beijerinckia sp. L45]|uniref:FAD/NAD(P)-binding protein n=1 Tax=Beijerinckia sp. L45 TaxID=1641855 RepID=UPI00131BC275|nr:FAD/NAD(P)-binding protein [Beijerinckia sp. L45]
MSTRPPVSSGAPTLSLPSRIAVVGAGFSGLLVALHLLRHNPAVTVVLIERAGAFARGLAYATSEPRHLLNVRASNMSAFPDDPDHFLRWLSLHGPADAKPQAFVPRHLFGTYLQTLLAATLATEDGAGRLRIVPDDAIALVDQPGCLGVRLAMGRVIDVDHVVLATGNLPPRDLPGLDAAVLASPAYIRDPWGADALATIGADDDVLLIGTGLTAVDVFVGLDRRGHKGHVVALSRRGLRPRAHAESGPAAPSRDIPTRPRLSDLLAFVRRAAAEESDWRAGADCLRPHIQRLWREASADERGRFLRHLRPWWDVHRHRIAPPVAAAVTAAESTGRLAFKAGKLVAARLDAETIHVMWRARGCRDPQATQVRHIVNCTGPTGDILRATAPLLADLVARGLARADAHGLGVEVDAACRLVNAEGRPSPTLSAIGPMSRGAFWEITAVPDIRIQARDVAARFS